MSTLGVGFSQGVVGKFQSLVRVVLNEHLVEKNKRYEIVGFNPSFGLC